ncbi:MAG: crossover junction endodeoxyribonuclease RuvC [Myxococcota bacterium]|nr:crossover junction endodeoxyribonuclease RuvC [Myxococcota bacterium]
MRILGIDPGSNATGFGIVERRGGEVSHVAHGVIRTRGDELADRLHHLHGAVRDVIEQHGPEVAAVEQVFVASSPRSALVLGQARGAVLVALGAAGLPVKEYSASEVKQAVCGQGRAAKVQVQRMVARLLQLERAPAQDAADALAVALRLAQGGRLEAAGAVAGGRRGRRRPPGLSVRPAR